MQLKTENPLRRRKEIKSWFFEEINKIDKPLVRLTKGKREKTQITNIRNQRGDITTDPTDVKRRFKG